MSQEEQDGGTLSRGADTENLRYVGNDIAEVEERGLASEIFDELQSRLENDVMLSSGARNLLSFTVPLFVAQGDHAIFWAFDLIKDCDYEDFRAELADHDRSPSWAIGRLLKAAIVSGSLLSRDVCNVFEIENGELLILELMADRFWKVSLGSERPDLTFDEDDRFFVVVNISSY